VVVPALHRRLLRRDVLGRLRRGVVGSVVIVVDLDPGHLAADIVLDEQRDLDLGAIVAAIAFAAGREALQPVGLAAGRGLVDDGRGRGPGGAGRSGGDHQQGEYRKAEEDHRVHGPAQRRTTLFAIDSSSRSILDQDDTLPYRASPGYLSVQTRHQAVRRSS